jgi:hypothetical protein
MSLPVEITLFENKPDRLQSADCRLKEKKTQNVSGREKEKVCIQRGRQAADKKERFFVKKKRVLGVVLC